MNTASADRIAASPSRPAPPPPPPPAPSRASGREVVDRHTQGDKTDVKAVAQDLRNEIRQRPNEATKLTKEALEQVKADDRDELAQEFVRAHSDSELKALGSSAAGKGALALSVNELTKGKVHKDEADDARRVGTALGTEIDVKVNAGWSWERASGAVHTVLDIAGFIPGLGAIPDLINAGIYAAEGDKLNAGLSLGAAVPIVGDAAKGTSMVVKGGKEVLEAGAKKAVREGAEAAGEKAVKEGLEAAGTKGANEAVQSGAKHADNAVDAVKGKTSYEATVRGEKVSLEGIEVRNVNYVKRDRASYEQLRKDFNATGRADYLKSLAADPAKVQALRRAGLDDAAIARVAEGKVPQGYQVHHKLPIDDGGTNSFDNLVLIKNDPYHIGITNAQSKLAGELKVGESAKIDWPVVPGFVYPAK